MLLVGVPSLALLAAHVRRLSPRLAIVTLLLILVAGRCLWECSLGTALLGAFLLLAFTVGLRLKDSYVPELVVSSIASAFGSFRHLWTFGESGIRLARPSRLARVPWFTLAVPLGLVLLFGAVFFFANPVVQRWAEVLLAHLPTLAWFPSPLRFVFWGGCALVAAGLLRPVCRTIPALEARLGGGHVDLSEGALATATRLSTVRNAMLALNVLFLAYNAVDFVYLWGGRTPDGVSHTEYAHGGAAWLTVALVLSTIVLGSLFRGPIQHDPRGGLAHALAYGWVAQNLVLAAGTFRRIQMYVAYSGLTDLRILGIFGTALVTVGLAVVVIKVARRRTMLWVLRRQLDALLLAIALFAVAPTSWLAMRYNVARISSDQYRPLLHLFQQPLTPEAVPQMLPLLDHPDQAVREGASVLLRDRGDQLQAEADSAKGWTQWEMARARALAALKEAEPRLVAASPSDRNAARATLRGIAYGINGEVEREGDDAPYDWRSRRYPARY
jgi:hypothetical protein